MTLSTNVQFFLELRDQLKICHWQTKGYARHMAFDRIYDDLGDLIDKFVEVAMGKYGRFSLSENESTIKIQNLTDLDLNVFVKGVKIKLVGLTNELSNKDTDLLNIRDEMLGSINQLSYLLTLE